MAAIAIFLLSATLTAHPLGNASVNHYARLVPSSDGVALTYILDLAEIPSFELFQSWGLEPRAASRAEIEAHAREQARQWIAQLRVTSSARPVAAQFSNAEVTIGDGAGGMLILRIAAHARIDARGHLQYEDHNYAERAGWKEIVIAAGEGAALIKASHPAKDLSQALSKYPEDPTLAPPQDLRAELSWTTPSPAPPSSSTPPAAPVAIEPLPQPAPSPAEVPAPPSISASATLAIGAAVLLLTGAAVRKFRQRPQ